MAQSHTNRPTIRAIRRSRSQFENVASLDVPQHNFNSTMKSPASKMAYLDTEELTDLEGFTSSEVSMAREIKALRISLEKALSGMDRLAQQMDRLVEENKVLRNLIVVTRLESRLLRSADLIDKERERSNQISFFGLPSDGNLSPEDFSKWLKDLDPTDSTGLLGAQPMSVYEVKKATKENGTSKNLHIIKFKRLNEHGGKVFTANTSKVLKKSGVSFSKSKGKLEMAAHKRFLEAISGKLNSPNFSWIIRGPFLYSSEGNSFFDYVDNDSKPITPEMECWIPDKFIPKNLK